MKYIYNTLLGNICIKLLFNVVNAIHSEYVNGVKWKWNIVEAGSVSVFSFSSPMLLHHKPKTYWLTNISVLLGIKLYSKYIFYCNIYCTQIFVILQ